VVGIGDLLLIAVSSPPMPRSAPAPAPVGISSALHEALQQLQLVAKRDTTVMLLGETGVGKEVLARHLHALSQRPGRFVAVNCAGLTESIVESTLFGHTRGAFTGAARARPGLAQSASGGTLFLDEVGDAPPGVQVALLRLLQEREVLPVGADAPIQVDVRFVSATHQDLDQAVAAGRLRADLRARLDQWSIEVPPLRERREDILPLAHHFAAKHTQAPVPLSLRLASALLLSDWPGNARELGAFMERVVISAPKQDPLDAAPQLLARISSNAAAPPRVQVRSMMQAPPSPEELRAVLEKTSGNMSAAARALGVGRSTIYRWLRAADIDPTSYRSKSSS
jgi:propionate catabolism operon transcriptional regulator